MKHTWKVVGHRGYPLRYPENTLPGFLAACHAGVDAIELDVQLSHDGVPVVLHDDELERTTNSKGKLRDFNFAELAHVSAHFPQKFGDEFLPLPLLSLEQVAAALAEHAKFVFIEIKEQSIPVLGRDEYLRRVLDASKILGHKRSIISFDYDILALAKSRCHLPVGFCIEEYSLQNLAQARKLKPDLFICDHNQVPEGTELWQGAWQWFFYGVENLEQAASLFRRGAIWIEADDPLAVMPNTANNDE